jgi:hypothetical protein
MSHFLRAALMFSLLGSLFGTRVRAEPLPEFKDLPSSAGLPDPLMMRSGQKVASKDDWVKNRRPELAELFQHYMYGHLPPKPAKLEWETLHEDRQAFGGKATLEEIAITVGPPQAPKIRLLLVVPTNRKGPAPVFVGVNFGGNHALVTDPKVKIPEVWMYPNRVGVKNNRATEEGRGKEIDTWSIEQSIDRGYAVATFYNGDLDPDRADRREGIRPYLLPEGDKKGSFMGSIAVWAWGVQRVVDYLVADKDIDSKRIICVGHSRLGKTTLLAGALDERISVVIPHQAGCGGTAPSRGKVGESVKQINDRFPHWFCDHFKQFNEHTDRLPFDQHCLIALCAPRAVLLTNAEEDQWANPNGQFEMLQAADPVYRLLGAGGLEAKQPEKGKLIDSKLGYFLRGGKHSMTKDDWKVFLDFADKHAGIVK